MLTRGKKARTKRDQELHDQVQRAPTGLGDFEKLPGELRNEIYRLALDPPEVVKLQSYQPRDELHYLIDGKPSSRVAGEEVAPVNHKRKSERRCQQWVGRKWVEAPRKTALLQVNKQFKTEASPILYGSSRFEFTTLPTFERFMKQVGDNKRFLTSVMFRCLSDGPETPAGRRAMEALVVAKSLHTVKLSDFPLYSPESHIQETIEQYVSMCLPVLKSIDKSQKAQNLNANIIYLLGLEVNYRTPSSLHRKESDCNEQCATRCVQRVNGGINFHRLGTYCQGWCKNMCVDFRERCEKVETSVEEEIAKQLELSTTGSAALSK